MNPKTLGRIFYSKSWSRSSPTLDVKLSATRRRRGTFNLHDNHRQRALSSQPSRSFRELLRGTTTLAPSARSISRSIMSGRVPIESQRVDAPLTASATFLVLTINPDPSAIKTVRSVLSSVDDLTKNVAFRDLQALFACTVGIGSDAWDQVTGLPRPAELHPFKEVKGKVHTAVSTPGDLLFHIRSQRRDLCFEFERQVMELLGDAVSVVDETVGFRYFDARDLLGFVDGTANPVGPAVNASIVVAEEDPGSAGGSYIVVQKYLHDMKRWRGLSTEAQESIIGRTKLDNIELDDADEGMQMSHKSLATIEDESGEHDILRDNMPFGSPGSKEFGTYFIGYSRKLWVTEKMLERMFIGNPPGLHDRILDYSTAVTGTTFFAPAANVLAGLGDD
ncbi:hypothetical protein PV05_10465 [Exophiala xenobiotica]|uniref:Dyp-type peroxidase n=1 Tax=Exophiala xenobiotica TaxID=348802 RepID=A0A0D2EV95_9EURO|nr:uncharacterized protein PV05_10465 [Exophiala xenobiotica]KIW51779.1 hypothetical protein PV05_10465 [Exophiala xenobiotica]